jgi:Phage gp6-like head-tail connector protein
MALLTLISPAQEPVSLAQMKVYLRLDAGDTSDDVLISSLISAAREWCEAFCERAFIFQVKRLLMDFFPGYVDFKMAGQRVSSPFVSGSNAVLVGIRYAVALPWPLVREVVDFIYQDQNGDPQTMIAGTDFVQDLDSQPARLTPLFGEMWPVARVVANAVQIDYLTGYFGSINVSMTNGSAVLTATLNGQQFPFLPRDVGAAISIPAALAGSPATALNTTIASVDDDGNATLAAGATNTTGAQTTTFGVLPQSIVAAIYLLTSLMYDKRQPIDGDVPEGVKMMLYPYRDLRF